jgi:hypothetical protein
MSNELVMRLKLLEFHNDLYVDNLSYIIKSYHDLLVTNNDLNQEIFKKTRENRNLENNFKKLQNNFEKMQSSRSWKLTEPIRKVGKLVRKFKKKFRIKYNSINDMFFSFIYFKILKHDVKISIIMANYNYAQLLPRGINSVISQTYNNWELIIVDDGSSDDSIDVINKFLISNPKIKLYQHEKGVNKGLKESLLLGLKHSSGKYVAFLEADDWWEDTYLEEKINVLKKHPRVKLIFNDIKMFTEENIDLSYFHNYFKWQKGILSNIDMPCRCSQFFSEHNFIPTFSCVLVEKK